MNMTDTSSSIGRLASLSRSPLLGVVQSGIGNWTGRIWFLSGYNNRSKPNSSSAPFCRVLSPALDLIWTDGQYINGWSLSILTIAISSLAIWPNAVDQPLIITYVKTSTHPSPCLSGSDAG